MSAVVAPLKSHATPTTPLFIVLFVLNLTASTTGMFARQSVSNCCTQGTNQISCKNVLDNDTVICAQNYLKNASQMATQPFKIIFDTCDANLLPDDFFQPFPLNGLQMTKCGLTQVPYRLFSSFCDKLVNTLGFDDNQITSLNDNGFAGCRQLTELVLSTNLLTKIKPKYFESLDSLQSLYLSDNRLTDISGFGNLARLQKLDLRWNVITDVDKDAFNGLNGLLQLYMESNSISTLVDGTFDAFQRFGIMVTLGGNNFYCNCSLQWLQEWILTYNTGNDAWCMEPIQQPLSSAYFECSSTISSRPTSKMITGSTTPLTSQTTTTFRAMTTNTGSTTALHIETTLDSLTWSSSQQSPATTDAITTNLTSSTTEAITTNLTSSTTTEAITTNLTSSTTKAINTTLMPSSTTELMSTVNTGTEQSWTFILSSETTIETETTSKPSISTATSSLDVITSSSSEFGNFTTTSETANTTPPWEPITNVTVTNDFKVSWSSQMTKVMILYAPVSGDCSESLINEKFVNMEDGVHIVIVENKTSYWIMDYEDTGHPYLVCVASPEPNEYFSELYCNQSCMTTTDSPTPPITTAFPINNDDGNNDLWRTLGAIACGIVAALLVVALVASCLRLFQKHKKKSWNNSTPVPLPRPLDTTSLSYVDPNSQSFGRNDPILRNREYHPRDYLYLEPNIFTPKKQGHTYASLGASGTYSSIHTSPVSSRSQLYTAAGTDRSGSESKDSHTTNRHLSDNQQVCPSIHSEASASPKSKPEEKSEGQPSSIRWSAAVDHKSMLY